MVETCCDVVSKSETSPEYESNTRAARRRRMEIRRFKFVADAVSPTGSDRCKRQKTEVPPKRDDAGIDAEAEEKPNLSSDLRLVLEKSFPKFGMTSVCGRRRDMEDAVSIHPSFFRPERQISERFHFFGVYDGHGCSHVKSISPLSLWFSTLLGFNICCTCFRWRCPVRRDFTASWRRSLKMPSRRRTGRRRWRGASLAWTRRSPGVQETDCWRRTAGASCKHRCAMRLDRRL